MNQDELIEKCRLTEEGITIELLKVYPNTYVNDLAPTEKAFVYSLIQAQLRKAIPIIQKAERQRFLEWLSNRRATDTAMDIYLQAEQTLKGEGDE